MAGRSRFLRISERAVALAGHRHDVAAAVLVAACWCAVGVGLDFPEEWFLLTNLLCTLVVLLLLLLMQHFQNRDMRALRAKADELIRSTDGQRNRMIGAEQREAHEIDGNWG
ncbi:low affinity iron permease family protein [Rhizobium sp. BK251]|uniref:low affinity iron permease family protein n=1 Tax=Rhizobium sp. BK251 TaxID=2512125 RepID=UPI00104AACF3|nr:low affinity iron permease family protein [Rhizobium sp. BK251]